MVNRMRHTRGKTRRRRANEHYAAPAVAHDPETGVPHLRHRASLKTGMYRGKRVLDVQPKSAMAKTRSAEAEQKAEEGDK